TVEIAGGGSAGGGWTELFNGANLDGWTYHPSQRGEWYVENGELISRGAKSHLFTQRGDFENFHLQVEFNINAKGNSGVFLRSHFDLTDRGELGLFPDG